MRFKVASAFVLVLILVQAIQLNAQIVDSSISATDVEALKRLAKNLYSASQSRDENALLGMLAPSVRYSSYGMRSDPVPLTSAKDKMIAVESLYPNTIGFCTVGDTLAELEKATDGEVLLKTMNTDAENTHDAQCASISVTRVGVKWLISDIYIPF